MSYKIVRRIFYVIEYAEDAHSLEEPSGHHLLREGTFLVIVSSHRSRPRGNGIEGLDSRGLLQQDPHTPRGGSEVISMKIFIFNLRGTPYAWEHSSFVGIMQPPSL